MIAALLAGGLWAGFGSPYINLIGQACVIFGIAALGQWMLVGGAGQIAISGGAFMGIGAFTAGLLANAGIENFFVILVVSAVVGFGVGLLSGIPGLRFRGLYLLLASLALQFIMQSISYQVQQKVSPAGLVVPPLTIGGKDFSFGTSFYWLVLVILVVIYALLAGLERTGVGVAWKALRESEVAAAMTGVDVTKWKLYAFAASGAITAIAGTLFAYSVGRADHESYTILVSISLLTMLFLGGSGSRIGALFGAVIITALPYFLQSEVSVWFQNAGLSFDWYTNNMSVINAGLFSAIFVIVILFEPEGIQGLLIKLETGIRSLFRHRSPKGAKGVES